jgi:hypothetical protein
MTQFMLLVVGLIGSIFTYRYISPQLETENWHFVEGTMKTMTLREYDRVTHDVKRFYTRLGVFYTYEYEGRYYQSNRISIGGIGELRTYEVERLIVKKQWKEGTRLSVYINEDNPSESVLIKKSSGVSKDKWIILGFFLILLIGATINLSISAVTKFLHVPEDFMAD